MRVPSEGRSTRGRRVLRVGCSRVRCRRGSACNPCGRDATRSPLLFRVPRRGRGLFDGQRDRCRRTPAESLYVPERADQNVRSTSGRRSHARGLSGATCRRHPLLPACSSPRWVPSQILQIEGGARLFAGRSHAGPASRAFERGPRAAIRGMTCVLQPSFGRTRAIEQTHYLLETLVSRSRFKSRSRLAKTHAVERGQSAVAPIGCCATARGVSRTQMAATMAANRPNMASA